MELYQAEWCPHSHKVRQRLTELGIDFTARQVVLHADAARIGASRTEKGIFTAVAGDASFRAPFGVSPEFTRYLHVRKEK